MKVYSISPNNFNQIFMRGYYKDYVMKTYGHQWYTLSDATLTEALDEFNRIEALKGNKITLDKFWD